MTDPDDEGGVNMFRMVFGKLRMQDPDVHDEAEYAQENIEHGHQLILETIQEVSDEWVTRSKLMKETGFSENGIKSLMDDLTQMGRVVSRANPQDKREKEFKMA